MKKRIVSLALIVIIVLPAVMLSSCGKKSLVPDSKIEGSSLYVKKVDGLSEGFILGMDASSVIAEENSGVKYYDFDGSERDVFEVLASSGVTHIRVRVWNDPYDADGNGYGGGNCDVETACKIGKRASDAGMKLIVDFHYSDFWADPSKQMAPKAWKSMDIAEKTEAAYQFTRDSLKKIREAGAEIAMVQVGNETNGSLCGERTWFNIQYIMAAGSKAIREQCPEALVAVHFANPEKAGAYLDYAWRLDYYSLDYDVFASSYYPYWHGTLENLSAVIEAIRTDFQKDVFVAETAWPFTLDDGDGAGNVIVELPGSRYREVTP